MRLAALVHRQRPRTDSVDEPPLTSRTRRAGSLARSANEINYLVDPACRATRLITNGAEALLEKPVEQLVLLGGGSRSAVWCQILADVLRRPLHVAREAESTCLGSGILAAAAVGLHPTIREAAAAMADVGALYLPNEGRAGTYDRLFGVYRQLYPRLKDVFAELSEVTR